MSVITRLQQHAPQLRSAARRHGLRHLRVFGSTVNKNNSHAPADIDLLVDPSPETTLLDLGAMQYESEQLLGHPVDLLTPGDLPEKFRAQVLNEAQPL